MINQLLEAGAKVDMLLWSAAVPDRIFPMPRIGQLSFDSRGCWGMCLLGLETSHCCTESFHGQSWYLLLPCDLQFLFYYLHELRLLLSWGNSTK